MIIALMFASAISKAQSTITWNMGMNIAPSSDGNAHPLITTNRNGNPLVIWNHSMKAMFSRWNGTAFTMPVMLNPMGMMVAGADWMGPDIASHGDTVYVVFKEAPEGADTSNIYCMTSFNGGMTFSTPVQVDNINDSISRFPTVTTDDIGNPIIAFMKFDPMFGDARWVVVSSNDFGTTFSADVKASGWSSMTSTVCDCCPGAIACSGNSVAMMYRDNNSDIRDTWAGISNDKGSTFVGGMNIDQQNWNIPTCPSTGPDGVIIGDTLYATFMSTASGTAKVYFSKSSISTMTGSVAMPVTGMIPGLTLQNFPRMASDGTAMAVVWKQKVSGNDQCVLQFTNNIAMGLSAAYDTVDLNDIMNVDVALNNGTLFVIWQDNNSGTIKYRSGTYTSVTAIDENISQSFFSIFPNPSTGIVNVESETVIEEIIVTNLLGQIIYQSSPNEKNVKVNIDKIGTYFVNLRSGEESTSKQVNIVK